MAPFVSSTCSRFREESLAVLCVDGTTVERACEATNGLSSRQLREALPQSEARTTAYS